MNEGTKPPEATVTQGVLNPISIAVLVLLIGIIALVLFKDELLSQKDIIPWSVAIIGVILAILIRPPLKSPTNGKRLLFCEWESLSD